MKRTPNIVEVRVRRYGDGYHARAGLGKAAKLANSTNSAGIAAFCAAAKYLTPFPRGTILTVEAVEGSDQHGSLFSAKRERVS